MQSELRRLVHVGADLNPLFFMVLEEAESAKG
jgi:hypothetical protein